MARNEQPHGGVTPVSRRVANLAHMLTRNARRFPDRIGLSWGEKTWSWRKIDARVSALASALAEKGVVKGDRILVHSKNCNEMFEAMFAAFKLGAVWVPTNFRLLSDEVSWLAQAAGAKAVFIHADFPEFEAPVRQAVPGAIIACMNGSGIGDFSLSGLIEAHSDVAFADARVDHDDPCWFFFTSGTTGRSKASVLTHGQMAFVITNHLCDLLPGIDETDASLVVAPLSHGAGVHQLNIVARGAATILMPGDRFDIEEAFRLIELHRVTNMFTVPTIVKLLVEHPAIDSFDHSSLRYVIYAGAPMYREDQKRALGKLGKVLVQYFGLGEVTGNITVLPAQLHEAEDGSKVKLGTCGFERTGMQISIQDDQGNELQPFETGEICVIGPAVFAGYYDNPEANAKAFRNGWFRTGDLGHLDGRGFSVYYRPRVGHVHLRRIEHLSARDRRKNPDASGHRGVRHRRRAGFDMG